MTGSSLQQFVKLAVVAVAVMALAETPAMAQGTAPVKYGPLTAGVGMGLSIIGAGIGLGLIGFAALSGIARQPEAKNDIQGVMFIMAGLVEGAAILSLILCLALLFL